jgi:hypothetical protein
MIIALNIPISFLESVRIDMEDLNTTVSDARNIQISAEQYNIIIKASIAINFDSMFFTIKKEVNITVTLQFQTESGKVICQNVSTKSDKPLETAILKLIENRILDNLNSMMATNLNKIFIHHLEISDDTISISFSPQ